MTTIDAHLHLWDRTRSDYAWQDRAPDTLRRSFAAAEAAAELLTAGIDAAVLVQAEDSEADTEYLLDLADRHRFVAGVVGWVRLEDPAAAAEQLAQYGDRLCGVRHLLHNDPRREEFLDLPEVTASAELLSDAGLALDIPDSWPRPLLDLHRFADRHPELIVVVDHLGKPPVDSAGLHAWAGCLRELALRPNVIAKLSGLQRPSAPYTPSALRPLLEVALETFGAGRLMYGGDWPMTVPDGGYQPHWLVIQTLLDELSVDERTAILGDTAVGVYRLGDNR